MNCLPNIFFKHEKYFFFVFKEIKIPRNFDKQNGPQGCAL